MYRVVNFLNFDILSKDNAKVKYAKSLFAMEVFERKKNVLPLKAFVYVMMPS